MTIKALLTSAAITAFIVAPAAAQETHLRIQTHYGPETISGKNAAQFIDDVQVMSNGEITIEMFYSSSVVASVETFDAAVNGILECDMTGGAYQTGKNPAFQFVGDIMGGYDTPYQQLGWLYKGGGYDAAQELYNQYGMHLVGWWVVGQESLASSKPIKTVDDFKNWKFRSPPGMETKIFEKLGASPIVMDFTEVFTALESGIIEGADASILANNKGMGLYDIVKHATYPGFHSMPSDHLACNKEIWDAMPEHHRRILDTAMQKLALQQALTAEYENNKAAAELRADGVTLHDLSPEARAAFREAAVSTWPEFATTEEAKALVDSHTEYLKSQGMAN
ncbi:TRAP transporter substrate-binding protein [Roseibium salinum]|uniref:TRAP transporter substrate-binding protein n=2 Tax=Roseibium salinum TaxID=1604349 RepID=A0ABT3QVS7_9HYPH|nr:TRAP transporter substrate-binding protein [Roseibium sp. DSM 29163]MCX2721012.1 TRAP transporter substrate-binding protein [Roseibium sp. DSM 29163]